MTSLPPELQYGHVVGRVILAVADSGDADTYPDAVPAQGTVTFTPKNPEIRVGEPITPASIGANPKITVTEPTPGSYRLEW